MPRTSRSTRFGIAYDGQEPHNKPIAPRYGKASCKTGPKDCPRYFAMGFAYAGKKGICVKMVVPSPIFPCTAFISSDELFTADVPCLYRGCDIGDDGLTCLRCGHRSTRRFNALSHSICKRKHLACVVCEIGIATVSDFQKHCKTGGHQAAAKSWTFVEEHQNGSISFHPHELPHLGSLGPETSAATDVNPLDFALVLDDGKEAEEHQPNVSQHRLELDLSAFQPITLALMAMMSADSTPTADLEALIGVAQSELAGRQQRMDNTVNPSYLAIAHASDSSSGSPTPEIDDANEDFLGLQFLEVNKASDNSFDLQSPWDDGVAD